ncbi:DUF6455 family protein [Ancylobacter pratisalsi]|uniref:DUF6455 domain-containing protein n=1 Tax=Ancylobacter pratisalsi TaxID=1745854 RepID=A0A6P1YGM3_9HYPH|nr:DUF6455 family protein [Ancylobacter pratisalsi]QIB32302.1 hypothetical protein G3A50_00220 [Ancylobacter pratisalsi]
MRVDTIDERLALFRQMMERAGLDPESTTISEEALMAAAQRCLGCRVGEECRTWLRDVPDHHPPAGFCRNVETFAAWVEQQVSEDLARREQAGSVGTGATGVA